MHIDPTTLMIAGSIVGVFSGIFLFGAWTHIRAEQALLWWSSAAFLFACGVGMIALSPLLPDPVGRLAGVALSILAPTAVWGGTRRFHDRNAPWPALAAGVLSWAAVVAIGRGPSVLAAIAGFAPWIAYLAAASFELWRGRAERLTARWPLAGLFLVHAAVFVGGIFDIISGSFVDGAPPSLKGWFGIIHIEGLAYFMGTALMMVGMAQQRKEHRAVHVAGLDSLTGTPNRGTFLALTERLLRRCREQGAPLSLIMFDLDHFKQINDTYGHPTGDNVIRAFAEAAQKAMRANDIIGRYGGEEFAVVLPGTAIEAAYVIAERIRHTFAETGRILEQVNIHATVSGGVAVAGARTSVPELIDAADRALYQAKNLGRNRIQRHDVGKPRDNVVRVA